jgi:hypothetical protein
MGMQIPLRQIKRRTHGNWRLPFQINGLKMVLAGLLFCLVLFNSMPASSATVPAGQSLTLAWNPSPDDSVVGYIIYYGAASETYDHRINVNDVTNATVSGLVSGATYYFTATSYNADGIESDYSNETSYTVPAMLSTQQFSGATAGQFTLTVSGLPGQTYQIQATSDFTTWAVIGTVTMGAGGSLDFTDTNAVSFSQRFYRTQETP